MKLVICYLGISLLPVYVIAQKTSIVDSTDPAHRTVVDGKQYHRSGSHNCVWRKPYRKECTAPVKVPIINLDTVAGGLTPVEQGGGRQTKTLRLKNPKGKQYVLRSIHK